MVFFDKKKFQCGEIEVSFPEANDISGIILICSTLTNDDWVELFLALNTIKNVPTYLIISYMGYARQHHKFSDTPSGFALFLNLLDQFGLKGVTFIDCHSDPILKTPMTHLSSTPIIATDITNRYNVKNLTLVAPDIGIAKVVQSIATKLGCDLIIGAKNRINDKVKGIILLGSCAGRQCIIIDDIVDSGNTLMRCAQSLVRMKASNVSAYITHALASEDVQKQLVTSYIDELIFTNTVSRARLKSKCITEISVAPLLAEHIREKIIKMIV